MLAIHARQNNLGDAAHILNTAKEDLVYWAVDMNFHESTKDRFLNNHMINLNNIAGIEVLNCLHNLQESPERTLLLKDFNALIERAATLNLGNQPVGVKKVKTSSIYSSLPYLF